MDEDKATTVGITLRLREDLRKDLEESARARRVSLNQECIDRLSYVRDRKGLLAEVMRLAFGDRLAGLLLALGFAMGAVANSHRRVGRIVDSKGVEVFNRRWGNSPPEWIDDPSTFSDTVEAANVLLHAARPEGGEIRHSRLGRYRARQVIDAMGRKTWPTSTLMFALPAKEVESINELLGPIAQRMTAAAKRRRAHFDAAPGEVPVVTGRVVEAPIEEREVKAKRDE
jgi:hypothetical protein